MVLLRHTRHLGLGVQNEAGQRLTVLPREYTDHSKYPLATIQEMTLHMDITRWSYQNHIDHMVIPTCVESSLVLLEEGVCYDQCKTLLAFALLHSVLQGQICLLLQVFLDFLPLHFSPL